jgi:hypothetical protein
VPLSAIDSISPALDDTKRILFAPWRFWVWSRMAMLGLLTGEFATGGWSGSFPAPHTNNRFPFSPISPRDSDAIFETLRQNWALAVLCGILLIALVFVAEYLSSVSRFVLLESVVTGKCELRKGWKRWKSKGLAYFAWDVGFGMCCVVGLFLLLGLPLWAILKKFPASETPNLSVLVSLGSVVLIAVASFLVVALVIDLLARDFLVPIMAVENCGVWRAWQRLLPMLTAEKRAYAGYILMKAVLAVGSAVFFGIIDLIALVIVLIPIGLVGVFVYLAFRGISLSWDLATVSVVVVVAAAVFAMILWLFAFLCSPALVFFQSYTLRFIASRLPSLNAAMSPIVITATLASVPPGSTMPSG